MTLSPVVVVVSDLRASSPELESERIVLADRDIAWVKKALSYHLRQHGLEVPPFPVAVAREEDRATKIVTEELILPLGNTVEQVVGESFQLPVVLDGETKLKPWEHFVEQDVGDSLQAPVVSNGETKLNPVEHFVEQVVGDNAYEADSDSTTVKDQIMNKRYNTMEFLAEKKCFKFRKKKQRLKTRKKDWESSEARNPQVEESFSLRKLGVNKSRMKRRSDCLKKESRELVQVFKNYGAKRGSYLLGYEFQSLDPIKPLGQAKLRIVQSERGGLFKHSSLKRSFGLGMVVLECLGVSGQKLTEGLIWNKGNKVLVDKKECSVLIDAMERQIQAEASGDELVQRIMLHGPATCHILILFQEQSMSNKRSMENLVSDNVLKLRVELITCGNQEELLVVGSLQALRQN